MCSERKPIDEAITEVMINEQTLPFDAEIPNRATRRAMEELEQGGGKRFDSVEALLIDLETGD
jgi:DNA-damage-inducible protein J